MSEAEQQAIMLDREVPGGDYATSGAGTAAWRCSVLPRNLVNAPGHGSNPRSRFQVRRVAG